MNYISLIILIYRVLYNLFIIDIVTYNNIDISSFRIIILTSIEVLIIFNDISFGVLLGTKKLIFRNLIIIKVLST